MNKKDCESCDHWQRQFGSIGICQIELPPWMIDAFIASGRESKAWESCAFWKEI